VIAGPFDVVDPREDPLAWLRVPELPSVAGRHVRDHQRQRVPALERRARQSWSRVVLRLVSTAPAAALTAAHRVTPALAASAAPRGLIRGLLCDPA
jgi:hypothetical protein